MENIEELRLRQKDVMPTNDVLEEVLVSSYIAYEMFQETLPELEIEQNWQWYAPHKVWAGKGQYFWTTVRGTKKEKVLYWLHVCEGYFNVAVWFKEKNRSEVLSADVNEETRKVICNAKTEMGLPTFPVLFRVTEIDQLTDIYKLIELKKKLEI